MELVVDGLQALRGDRIILDDVSLRAKRGVTILMGDNGVGKSTLLNAIAGLVPAAGGSISLSGQPLAGHPMGTLAYVQQRAEDILPWRTVLGNVLIGAELLGRYELLAGAFGEIARVGLSGREMELAKTLSGGERARAALARAFLSEPKLLLLDEPCAPVDLRGRFEVYRCLRKLARERQVVVILTTHDPRDAIFCGDSVYILRKRRDRPGAECARVMDVSLGEDRDSQRILPDFGDSVARLEIELLQGAL